MDLKKVGLLSSNPKSSQNSNFERFEKSMEGVRFSGFFTVDGSAKPPSEEVYEIQSVQKFGNEDLWIFTAVKIHKSSFPNF